MLGPTTVLNVVARVKVTVEPPVLVTRTWASFAVPVWSPNWRVWMVPRPVIVVAPRVTPVGTVPVSEKLRVPAATPVPVNATGEPVTGTLPVMVTVPVLAPALVGENLTMIVQVEAAAKVAPQVPPCLLN